MHSFPHSFRNLKTGDTRVAEKETHVVSEPLRFLSNLEGIE